MPSIESLDVVSVGSSATLIVGGSDISEAGGGTSFEIYNEDAAVVVLIGGSNVTAATGIPLGTESSKVFFLKPGQELYGITASTADVRIMKVSG